jgi:3-dehydroquinate synthase
MTQPNDAPLTLTVPLDDRAYEIHTGAGLLGTVGVTLRRLSKAARVFVVSNETVAPLYLSHLNAALESAGFTVASFSLRDGEQYKNWDELSKILTWLLENGAERSSPLIALGGGVIGDISGLAAALYQRGMPLIQVPTTLLAQVDSSVGGKTAVNHPLGKNMIGAFHQPAAVIIDTDTLATLPDREFRSGIAEIIKYGAIMDAEFFDWLSANVSAILARDPHALRHAIHQSCRCKAKIVAEDEKEQGVRAWLNLGHTFGHAIETEQGYGTWLHGEAVAMGMAMAARLSVNVCGLAVSEATRLNDLIAAFGLPTVPPHIDADTWLTLMKRDKKTVGGKLRFVLLNKIGEATIVGDVDEETVKAVL